MQSPQRENITISYVAHINNNQIGEPPDQIIWLHEDEVRDKLAVYPGKIFETNWRGRFLIYKFKEYKDGWWKLEWPD